MYESIRNFHLMQESICLSLRIILTINYIILILILFLIYKPLDPEFIITKLGQFKLEYIY